MMIGQHVAFVSARAEQTRAMIKEMTKRRDAAKTGAERRAIDEEIRQAKEAWFDDVAPALRAVRSL